MEQLKSLWLEHVTHIDSCIHMSSFSNQDLATWISPLIDSITDEGAVPYLLNTMERFRASPLSSTISWLDQENLIPLAVLDKMQDMLLELRDSGMSADPHVGNTKKKPGDEDGWSLGEGVSVWSTSMAIIALLDSHGNGQKKATAFKSSILWLANQSCIDTKGWAYQLYPNCSANPVMTALALRALALALTPPNKTNFQFSSDEVHTIYNAIISGLDYLKSTCVQTHRKSYWCFNDTPHCAATTWALLALRQILLTGETFSGFDEGYYNSVKERALLFILSEIPKQFTKWEDEQFVFEGGAKYDKQKNYFSYSPTLFPQLFDIGLSPYHPKVINQIKWIVDNPDKWKITGYDQNITCTFTYAMVLATIISWAKRVGTELSPRLLKPDSTSIFAKASKALLGFNLSIKDDFQLVLNNRLWIVPFTIFVFILIVLFGHIIVDKVSFLSTMIVGLWNQSASDRHSIFINLVSTALYGLLALILVGIFKITKHFIKCFMRRF